MKVEHNYKQIATSLAHEHGPFGLGAKDVQALSEMMGISATDILLAASSPQAVKSLAYRVGTAEGEAFVRQWGRFPLVDPAKDLQAARGQVVARAAETQSTSDVRAKAILGAYTEGFMHGMSIRASYIAYKDEYKEIREEAESEGKKKITPARLQELSASARSSWSESTDPQEFFLTISRYALAVRELLAADRERFEKGLQQTRGADGRLGVESLLKMQQKMSRGERVQEKESERLIRFANQNRDLVSELGGELPVSRVPQAVREEEEYLSLGRESSLERLREVLNNFDTPLPTPDSLKTETSTSSAARARGRA